MVFTHILGVSRAANVARLAATAVNANAIAKLAIRGSEKAYAAKNVAVKRLLELGEARLVGSDPNTPGFRTAFIPAGAGKWRRVHHPEK
jgi:hypothetical protein